MSELGTTDHLLEAMGDDAYAYTQKHLRTVIEAAKREAVDNPARIAADWLNTPEGSAAVRSVIEQFPDEILEGFPSNDQVPIGWRHDKLARAIATAIAESVK